MAYMKKCIMLLLCLGVVIPAYGDEMNALINELDHKYNALTPAPNSSINNDYKLSQTALGSLYVAKSLALIYEQNQRISGKYDRIIEQNREIIKLLKKIAQRAPAENATP